MTKVQNPAEPVFFATPASFRSWLGRNHHREQELWVGYYKKDSRRRSITWPESVDEALCFGWIDGIRKAVDEHSYKIRFTPRRRTSIWSTINITKVEALTTAGRMQPPGLAAFHARQPNKVGIYSYEQRPTGLPAAEAKIFKRNVPAWRFWNSLPPGYRRQMIWRIVSARKSATRQSRFAQLIENCAQRRRL